MVTQARSDSTARDRAGIAMATALGGLVIIGVMIAGVFFTSNQELRVGTNTFVQERAFRAAEFGINAALAGWNNAEMLVLPIGGTKQVVYDSSAKGWRNTVTITRLNATGFLIGSTGTAFGGIQGISRRRTALLVRISVPSIKLIAALATQGKAKVESSVSGLDVNPLNWAACPPLTTAAPALAHPDTANREFKVECLAYECLLGSPKLVQSPAAADTGTYFEFGDENWASLLTYSPKTYTKSNKAPDYIAPVLSANGSCDVANNGNWGDPTRSTPARPCESYFPIIHAQGDKENFVLKGGSGQGILLVEGNLTIEKDFTFYGPIIVRGRFEIKDDGRVHGTVMAANTGKFETKVADRSSIQHSSCAIQKAFQNAVPPKRVVQRAWMEVF